MEKPHVLVYEKDLLTIKGVVQVVQVDEREGQFALTQNLLVVKGSGLNIVKLDKAEGIVVLEVKSLSTLTYKQKGLNLKGFFK